MYAKSKTDVFVNPHKDVVSSGGLVSCLSPNLLLHAPLRISLVRRFFYTDFVYPNVIKSPLWCWLQSHSQCSRMPPNVQAVSVITEKGRRFPHLLVSMGIIPRYLGSGVQNISVH